MIPILFLSLAPSQLPTLNPFQLMWETKSSRVLDCEFLYSSAGRRALGEVGQSVRALNDDAIVPSAWTSTMDYFSGSGVDLGAGTSVTW